MTSAARSVLAALGMLVAMMTLGVIWACHGAFVYTLDDPYVHLALAEQIASGHYGINPTESSSPSSSILWPFLLAPLARFPIGEFWPLILNIGLLFLFALVVLDTVGRIIERLYAGATPGAVAASAILVVLASNAVPLVFTGMEHVAQLTCAALVARGLILVETSDPVLAPDSPAHAFPRSAWAALILGPLFRYECLAITVPVLGYLATLGARRPALLVLGLTIVPLAAFSTFLVFLDLDPIPMSIQAKSDLAQAQGAMEKIGALSRHVTDAVVNENRGLLIVICGLLAVCLGEASGRRRLGVAVAAVAALHVCFGEYGWFGRYETYCWLFAMLTIAFLLASLRAERRATRPSRKVVVLAASTIAILSAPYLAEVPQTILAARSISAQQGSLAEFARQYGRTLAVNDIGLVSYRTTQYIVDLWGLASPEALHARLLREPGWLARIVAKRNARAIAIYERTFRFQVPGDWKPVARLESDLTGATFADPVVTFFATDTESVAEVRAALERAQPFFAASSSLTWDEWTPVPGPRPR